MVGSIGSLFTMTLALPPSMAFRPVLSPRRPTDELPAHAVTAASAAHFFKHLTRSVAALRNFFAPLWPRTWFKPRSTLTLSAAVFLGAGMAPTHYSAHTFQQITDASHICAAVRGGDGTTLPDDTFAIETPALAAQRRLRHVTWQLDSAVAVGDHDAVEMLTKQYRPEIELLLQRRTSAEFSAMRAMLAWYLPVPATNTVETGAHVALGTHHQFALAA